MKRGGGWLGNTSVVCVDLVPRKEIETVSVSSESLGGQERLDLMPSSTKDAERRK